MKLSKLRIKNFRGIKDLELDLDDDTTVPIGENNSGKTAVLDALRICLRELGPRRELVFEPWDFHLKDEFAAPTSADPISIELTLLEEEGKDGEEQIVGRLNRSKIVQVDDSGRSKVIFHVTCVYDDSEREYKTEKDFLNLDEQKLTGIAASALSVLQREIAYFYLAALRDAAKHFDAKGPFWRPFLRENQLLPEKQEEIEERLREVNDLVVDSHASFEKVRDRLKEVQEIVPLASDEVVSIEAVPGRMFDILAKAQVQLGTIAGSKVPVDRHGEGTQSLAVLMLFSAFLNAWPKSAPIIALEEPEAHLHPSAVRALWRTVNSMPGQKLFSTHSGDLLSEVPARSIRRMVRTRKGIEAFRLNPDTLCKKEERQFNYHIRYGRGELLFAKCWLLVEGETEVTLLPEIARHLGIDLEQWGVRCVPHRNASIELYLKVARDLGIQWCVLADDDRQGQKDQQHVRSYTDSKDMNEVLHIMPEKDIEEHLCAHGFGNIYEAYLSPQTHSQVTVPGIDPQYWPQVLNAVKKPLVKPAAALEVANQIREDSKPVPPCLETTVRKAVEIAKVA